MAEQPRSESLEARLRRMEIELAEIKALLQSIYDRVVTTRLGHS